MGEVRKGLRFIAYNYKDIVYTIVEIKNGNVFINWGSMQELPVRYDEKMVEDMFMNKTWKMYED